MARHKVYLLLTESSVQTRLSFSTLQPFTLEYVNFSVFTVGGQEAGRAYGMFLRDRPRGALYPRAPRLLHQNQVTRLPSNCKGGWEVEDLMDIWRTLIILPQSGNHKKGKEGGPVAMRTSY